MQHTLSDRKSVVYRPSMRVSGLSPNPPLSLHSSRLVTPPPSCLVQQNQELSRLILSLQERLDNTNSQNTRLLTEKQGLQTDIDNVQHELAGMKIELSHMARKHEEDLLTEKNRAQQQEEVNSRLGGRMHLLEEKSSRQETQLTEAREENKSQAEEVGRLERNLKIMTDICNRQQEEIKAMQEKEERQLETHRRQGEELKAVSSQTKRDAQLLDQSRQQVVGTATQLEQERSNSQRLMQERQSQQQEREKETILLVDELERLQAELQCRMTVTQDLHVYQAQHSFLLLEVNRLHRTIFSLEKDLEQLKCSQNSKEQPNLILLGQLVLMAAELNSLRRTLPC